MSLAAIPKICDGLLEDTKKINFQSIDKVELSAAGIYQLSISLDVVSLEALVRVRECADFLIVFGQSALSSRSRLPVFHRWTWFDDFPQAHCVALNDPTLFLNESMLGGWFQGTESRFYMNDGVDFVAHLASQLGVAPNRILFYGSSAGGFSSLMMAGMLNGSTAIPDIPQTDLRKYHVKSKVNSLLQNCYGGLSMEDVVASYSYRMSVVELYKRIEYIPNIIYLQNCADTIHLQDHMLPFLEGVEELLPRSGNQLVIEMYSARTEKGDGHVSAPRGMVGRVIKGVMKKLAR